jgi:hypothetical protein
MTRIEDKKEFIHFPSILRAVIIEQLNSRQKKHLLKPIFLEAELFKTL